MKVNLYLVFLCILSLLYAYEIQGQNILEDYNPSFEHSIEGWSDTGNATLTAVAGGAQTPGAAKLQVTQTNGNLSNAQLQSPHILIDPTLNGEMLYLSLYARSNDNSHQFRIRIEITNEDGSESSQQSRTLQLTSTFQPQHMPVFIPESAHSLQIQLQCGLSTGNYFFDDFNLVLASVAPAEIQQFQEWQPRSFQRPSLVQVQSLTQTDASVSLTLNTAQALGPVMDTQFGVNSNFRSGNSLVDRAPLYESFGAFRFPAGSGSNLYFWDCEIPESFAIDVNPICAIGNNRLSPEHFVTFKNNAKGEPTVVVNYFYARYGVTPEGTREARVEQAADYAAGLVHHLNIELGADIKYWEVGNECYGPWETGYEVNGSIVTGTEYGEDFRVFAQAMKAVDPDIQIGAVLSHKDFDWNNQVLPEVQDYADFLIVHHYFEVEDAQTVAVALQEIDNDMQEIQAAAAFHTDKPEGYFPVAFTEFNIQGDQATTITNGLFVAEALLQMVKSRYSLTNIWVNEWNLDGFHSKGLLAQNDPNQADYSARPSYTPFYFFDKCLGDQMVGVSHNGNAQVRAYASTFSSGEVGLFVVNYGNAAQTLEFNFTNPNITSDSIFWYSVHADNQQAGNMKFYVNGQSSSTPGGGPANLNAVPAFVAPYMPGKKLTIPKFSATYIVLNTQLNTSTGSLEQQSKLMLFPNPARNYVLIQGKMDIQTTLAVFDQNGKNQTEKTQLLSTTPHQRQLDLSALSAGLYFIQAGDQVLKMIKQ